MFLKLMQEVQSLNAQQFYSMVASCLALVTDTHDELKPEGFKLSEEAKSILFRIVQECAALTENDDITGI